MNIQAYTNIIAGLAVITERYPMTGMNIIFDLSGVLFEQHTSIEKAHYGAVHALKPTDFARTLRLLQDCMKQGHRLFVVSNLSQQWCEFLIGDPRIAQIFSFFDDIILADAVGLRKPDPRIFNHLIEKHQLDPRYCIFIDDQKINLEAAQQAGIFKGILCRDLNLAQVRLDLQSHGAL